MDAIEIKAVTTKRDISVFASFANRLYAGNPYFVPDWEADIRDLFSEEKNPSLAFCDIQAFLAVRAGEVVGRVLAFVNRRSNDRWQTRTVRFSYLDFIEDRLVCQLLMQAVEDFGRSHGMDTVQGPLGFTDFDKEGMLVEDFDRLSSPVTYYNASYYPVMLEKLGYEKAADWVQLRLTLPAEAPAKYTRVAAYVRDQLHLRVRTLSTKEVTREGYGQRIFHLLNEAYAPLFGFTPFSDEQIRDIVALYALLADWRLIPVIEDEQGELVGVAVTMGSLAHAMRAAKGRLWPLGWWHLLRALKWQHSDTVEMLLIAVRPDLQGYGLNALFFDYLTPVYHRLGYRYAETGPQLEDNLRELAQWKPLRPEMIKRRRCYKKMIGK